MVGTRHFDLNIEEILENWEVHHALREIISNALDEQKLSNSREVEIFQDKMSNWHIKDYGRGLNYRHLTQNENEEKLRNDTLIGRFGVGLKDALATLHRHKIGILIRSRFGLITVSNMSKSGFNDIVTLHADISAPDDTNMIGTEFILSDCSECDVAKAKKLFLEYAGERILTKTKYGEIVERNNEPANIFINGVCVAHEPNFLFSYNITSLTKQLKKALNRERTNVGRTAYKDRVEQILCDCEEKIVADALIRDLLMYSKGEMHDEMEWGNVKTHTAALLARRQNNDVVFVTSKTVSENPTLIDEIQRSGKNIVTVPENIEKRINTEIPEALTANRFKENMISNLKIEFISPQELSASERKVYDSTECILGMIGGCPECIKEIQIAQKIEPLALFWDTYGLWQSSFGRITIRRDSLSSLSSYAGVLIHECLHAKTGYEDVSRDFETELSNMIGNLASLAILLKNNSFVAVSLKKEIQKKQFEKDSMLRRITRFFSGT